MVAGSFPAIKLGILAVRQISKPIAKAIIDSAKAHPLFCRYICIPPAQLYNFVEVKYKMWIMNLGKPAHIPELTEAMAIEVGANLLSEIIIFTIGATILVIEYVKSVKKEAQKEKSAKLEKLEIGLTISELGFRIEQQDAQIKELTRILADVNSRSIFKTIMNTDILTFSNDSHENVLARKSDARTTAN